MYQPPHTHPPAYATADMRYRRSWTRSVLNTFYSCLRTAAHIVDLDLFAKQRKKSHFISWLFQEPHVDHSGLEPISVYRRRSLPFSVKERVLAIHMASPLASSGCLEERARVFGRTDFGRRSTIMLNPIGQGCTEPGNLPPGATCPLVKLECFNDEPIYRGNCIR